MIYRAEIDGLRAIAVLPVLFFHAEMTWFSGGFVGVDIFFVISGYLITTIILNDLKQDRFSIVQFYERRARRILPALSFILLVFFVVAFISYPPYLLKEFSQSLVSISVFLSNIFFSLEGEYFGTNAEEMALLHTWSLSVEEQFYIFFPLMLIVLYKRDSSKIILFIVFLALFSFAAMCLLISLEKYDESFYWILSRAWELAVGSIAALILLQTSIYSRVVNETFSLLGFILILGSIFFITKEHIYPSVLTLLPVVGVFLVIMFAHKKTTVARILSAKPLVAIGLISYSLYLWHQPIFVTYRIKSIGTPDLFTYLLLILISFILAYISWQFIEKPFRDKNRFNRKSIFIYSVASLGLMFSIGLYGHISDGFEFRFNSIYENSITHSPKRVDCHSSNSNYIKPNDACKYFGEKITWAVLGDSHSLEPAYAISKFLEDKHEGVVHFTYSSCPPALNYYNSKGNCSKFINDSLSYIEDNSTIKNVYLGFRHTAHLMGDQLKSYPLIVTKDEIFKNYIFPNAKTNTLEGKRNEYWDNFVEIIERLLIANKRVFIQYPIPELPVDIKKIIIPNSILNDKTMLNLDAITSKAYYLDRNRIILNLLDSLDYSDKLIAVKTYDVFCTSDSCKAVIDGKSLYFDDDHLSIYGATLLVDKYIIDIGKYEN